ncbi:unnamed protein product [Bemisia tabaci]|uniref:C2H2-type domain-containing protein n=1 Tax=Bemisia tabaci TaxID=7038 RepID=A0A9P0CCR4_BEMTA|nr:unnamed protein product [Bemisia tabaci]
MNSFDELAEYFPSENLVNMGSYSNHTNDVLLEIFRTERPLSASQSDTTKIGPDTVEFVSTDEAEYQNQEIFDLIGDSCFKETSNYCSLLDLDVLGTELPKGLFNDQTRSSTAESSGKNDSSTEICSHFIGSKPCEGSALSETVKHVENGDSCIHKIVDLLATLVDETSPNDEINFNTDLSDLPKNEAANVFSELQSSREGISLKSFANSSSQTTAFHSNTILKEKFFDHDSHLSPHANFSLGSISESDSQILKKNHSATNLDVFFKSKDVAVCQQVGKDSPTSQVQKRTPRPLLPQLTEFACEFCQPRLFFLSKNDFLQHKRCHEDVKTRERKFKCQECDETFSVYTKYLNHIRHHRKKKCEFCLKEFLPTSLKNHLRIHDPSQRLLCEHCGLRFVSKLKLNEHLSLLSNQKPYTCELCNRQFSSHGSYWIHKKYHASSFPVKCICGQTFRHLSSLRKHCRISGCSNSSDFISTSCIPLEQNLLSSVVAEESKMSPACNSKCSTESGSTSSAEGGINHPSKDLNTKSNKNLLVTEFNHSSATICSRSFELKPNDNGSKPNDTSETDLTLRSFNWESCTDRSSSTANDSNGDHNQLTNENSEGSSGYVSACDSVESNDSVVNRVDKGWRSSVDENMNESENFKIVLSRYSKREVDLKACRLPNASTVQFILNSPKNSEEFPFKCERCLKSFSVRGSFLRHQKSLLACNLEIKKQLQVKLKTTGEIPSKATSASFVCEKCLQTFPFKWSLQRHQKSLTACNSGIKKRQQRSKDIQGSMLKKKVLVPKLNSPDSHCPYCNIQFPDLESFLFHFQNECNHLA